MGLSWISTNSLKAASSIRLLSRTHIIQVIADGPKQGEISEGHQLHKAQ